MSRARRTKVKIFFNGRAISNYVMDFSYTDNTDKSDDISLKLSDRDERWAKDWFPETGDVLDCEIQVFDWNYPGDNRSISLGKFEVDNVEFSDVVIINAVSVPITSSIRSEKKYKTWEQISLSNIAGDISGSAGLTLVYETDIDPYYDSANQSDKSDLEFLEELCKSDGMCLKVTDSQLIIFEESKYDTLPVVNTIKRGASNIIGIPRFSRNAKNIYAACEITYFDSKTDTTYTGRFDAPEVGNVGHILKLRENFNSESDDINLDRKAKARLREKNKLEWTCDVTLNGDIIYFAGTNIEFTGWHKFDGKYHIMSCTHSIGGNGYTIRLSTRRCLEGY